MEMDSCFRSAWRVPSLWTWWTAHEGEFDEGRARTVASGTAVLPSSPPNAEAAGAGSSCSPDDTWDNGSLDDWIEGRSGPTAVWTGSLVLIWGGYNGDPNNN